MNKLDLNKKRRETHSNYHIPSHPNYVKRPKNALYLSAANSIDHELAKAEVCWWIKKLGMEFITEAVRNKGSIRVDVVILDTGQELEVIHSNRKDEVIDRYKREFIITIYTGKPIGEQLQKQLII